MTSPSFDASLVSLRAARAGASEPTGFDLVGVARQAVRPEQMVGFADAVAGLGDNQAGLPTKRIAVLGEVTLNGIAAAASTALGCQGIVANSYVAPYGTFRQEILDPSSGLYAFRPEIVLIVPRPEIALTGEGPEHLDRWIEDLADEYFRLWAILAERLPGVHVIQHLYEAPDDDLLGPAELQAAWSPLRVTQRVNELLTTRAPRFLHLIDTDRVAARVGRQSWRDLRLWYHGKVPFSLKHLGDYRVVLAAALRRALGHTAKALVVDLDNTLWRGVIGDDGIEGIGLGPDTPVGEAHYSFCEYVKALGRRGVILGICSKNDPDLALTVFDSHPHMPLRRDDFAAIECNWDDKASNLRKLAAELNIDLSAVVFVDDNEAECDLVRRELPTVTVVPLRGDPADFRRQLDSLRLFEADSYSAEDLNRQASYRGRREAHVARTQARDLDGYLASLQMRGRIWNARDENLARLAQMETKTNQFNLTTRRWSADQLRTFMTAPDYDLLCFRMADRFADHGLVSSLVVQYTGAEARIVSWLMSCRVFSRGAEDFILNLVLELAAARGANILVGEYVSTERNAVVADLYPRLGFSGGNGCFRLPVVPDAKRQTFIAAE